MADSLDKFMDRMSKFMDEQKEGATKGAGRPVKQYPLSLTSVVAPTTGIPTLTGGAGRGATNIEEQIAQSRLNKRAMDMLRKEEQVDEERMRRETMENKAATLEAEVRLERLKREQQTGVDGAKGPLDPVHQTVQVMSAMKNLETQMGGGSGGQAEMAKTLFEAQKAFQQQLFQMQSDNQKNLQLLQEKVAAAEKTALQVQLDNLNRTLSEMKNAQQPKDVVGQMKDLMKLRNELGGGGEAPIDPAVKKIDLAIEDVKAQTAFNIKKMEVEHLRWVEEQKSTNAKWEAAISAGLPLLNTVLGPLVQKAAASAGAGQNPPPPPPPGPPSLPQGQPLTVADRPPTEPVQGPPPPPPPPGGVAPGQGLKVTCPICKHVFDTSAGKARYWCPFCLTELKPNV